MKKKVAKYIGLAILVVLVVAMIFNIYSWIVSGKQDIKISIPNKAFTNSDLYVSMIAQEHGTDLETKTKIKLVDSNGKKVKNVKTKYEGNTAVLSIPSIETGNYFLEAKVSSKAGKDKIKKEVYISNGNTENVTISLDKGIYKPGDIVNYRALLTNKDNDEPVSKDINVSIYDGNDNKVYNENIKTSNYGIVSGTFTLASEVNSGLYKLVVKSNENETTKQFKVNPYVTPKYEVKIELDKQKYLVGDTAKISFNLKYFFGEAVKDADLKVYINNEEYKTLKSNEQGIATIDYEIKDAKTYNVKVEAVDSSNYYVETASSFSAGTDLFEIQLLPEYGKLSAGRKNDVYVFTTNADGTPIKTYITVSSGNFNKQISTDENGIGKFSIDIDQINNSYTYGNNQSVQTNTKQFSIIAEDENKNKIQKKVELDIIQNDLLLSTNKVKYEQGEDIQIKVSSITENAKNIYFFKDNKLIKMLSTELDDTIVNLEDNYGLIDIYVTEKSNNQSYNRDYYYNTTKSSSANSQNKTFKKTIFIKPTKQLNIAINTDKQEYKPGEKINISFNTQDESKTNVDAALLVSMLDNSVLNLANNDLSIDNIKLALQNIKFSDELDAATLYSCIVNDKSEQTIMALLLKQTGKDLNVTETRIQNKDQREEAKTISIILITIIAIALIIYLFVRFKQLRKCVKHMVNFIVLDSLMAFTIAVIIEEFFWRTEFSWLIFAITTIIGLAIYILFISRFSKNIFRTSISIIITVLITILLGISIDELDFSPLIIILVVSAIILILAIFAKICEVKKLRTKKSIRLVFEEIEYIFKYIGTLMISLLFGYIMESILKIEFIRFPIAIIGTYLINYFFNLKEKEENIEIINNNQHKYNIIVISLAIIGLMAVGYFVISAFNQAKNSVGNADIDYRYDTIPTPRTDFYADNALSSEESKGNSGKSSILDNFDIFTSSNGNKTKDSKIDIAQETNEENREEAEKVTDDDIRNVFLESMCFIPELVTNGGTANINLKLSDNITTWTIQTVGNTKDGKIGYGMLDNVKVFKDFFVDFELPKNLVETDTVSIPVTVYNYTDNQIDTVLKIKEEEWFKLENNNINISVNAKSTNMVYVPISILKPGNNKFRVEVASSSLTDIVEKECLVSTKGYKVEKVVSTGNLDEDISEDILILDDFIENTGKAKIKIYASSSSQTIEGMENIFKMPTGCFEQISSTLYPNILALKYLEDNGIVNEELKTKALSYISSGYQKLLTYEVKGESGGYSLYGHSPAETVLTAYGLMEITDLSKVYSVDDSVINKMTEFLYRKQNSNGTFTITGSHIGGANSRDTLALNAYITWALSESNPKDNRLSKSVDYLKNKLDSIDDNYTLALVANTLANVNDKELNNVLKRLVNNTKLDGKNAIITSNTVDYYGSRSNVQNIQTVALTSMALSKGSYNVETNKMLINYLISQKDTRGTWYSTQATILALKALNIKNDKNQLENQTITVRVNDNEQKIEIKDNPLELYELTFDNLNKENKLNIDVQKGSSYFEVIEEYYIPYEKVDTDKNNIEVSVESNNDLKVNETLKANIKLVNRSENTILNGMVTIDIPQGFVVNEESLMLLEKNGIIEKYETSYTAINIYLRNFDIGQVVDLGVSFRASYPVDITGMAVKVYDYYNPEIIGTSMPIKINVRQ